MFDVRVRNRAVLVAFFALGAYAVVAQSLILREFLVVAFGNELSWGLTFFGWLAGVGVGAAIGGYASRRERARLALFALALVLLALLTPVEIIVIRIIRAAFDVAPGENLSLWTMLWLNPLLTMPVSFFVGFAFPLASALMASPLAGVVRPPGGAPDETDRPTPPEPGGSRSGQARGPDYMISADPIAQVYIVEALGSLVGGALFSFVLIERVRALPLATVSGVALFSALLFLLRHRRQAVLLLFACVFLAMGTTVILKAFALPAGMDLDPWSINKRWDSFHTGTEIVGAPVDSRYQNITLAREGSQYSVFLDGLVATDFDPTTEFARVPTIINTHLVMCEAASVKRVLLIGGGITGRIAEMLRYREIERLDYVQLDPKLLDLVLPHLDKADRDALMDPRLVIHHDDGRHFLSAAEGQTWDLVVLDMPEPTSILLNRFYTREFYRLTASRLADDGVLAFTLTGSPGHYDDLRLTYLGSIWKALGRALPERLATWGDEITVLAAKREGILTIDPAELTRRYGSRGPDASGHFDPRYWDGDEAIDPAKVEQLRDILTQAAREAPPNTDDRPVACLYNLLLWDRMTESGLLGFSERVTLANVLIAVAIVFALWIVAGKFALGHTWSESATLFSVASTGFATMSLELVLLMMFQSLFGYVYTRIGIIVGVFMFGLVLGCILMRKYVRRRTDAGLGMLRNVDLVFFGFALMLAPVYAIFSDVSGAFAWVHEWGIMAFVLLTGLLGGAVYPIAANVLVREKPLDRAQGPESLDDGRDHEPVEGPVEGHAGRLRQSPDHGRNDGRTGRAAGSVDAADHVGACIGALITGVVLLPALGITFTCIALAGLKLLSAVFLRFAPRCARPSR